MKGTLHVSMGIRNVLYVCLNILRKLLSKNSAKYVMAAARRLL